MKKSAVVFAAVLLLAAFVPQPVAAQVSTDFGLKAGVSLASYKWSDDTEASDGLLQPVLALSSLSISARLSRSSRKSTI